MGGNSGDQEAGDRAAAADYVAELSAELAKLARRHGLETLGFSTWRGSKPKAPTAT